jgi:rhomboid protease GluP
VFLKRQREGSVICTSCGVLVGVNDDRCYNCGRRNPGLWGYAQSLRRLGQDLGFVPLVMGATIVMYVLSLLLSRGNMGMGLSPAREILILLGASGATPVYGAGLWWTIFTASWLHGGVLHVLFNVLWIRNLGPSVAEIYGPARMVIIYVASGAIGFLISSTAGNYLWALPVPFLRGAVDITVGASAPIFGLLGAIVHYGRRSGSSIAAQTGIQYAVILGVFGLIFPGIDNWAHAGGFLGGFLAAKVLDPLKPERTDHMVIAGISLLVTLIALGATFVTVLPYLLAQ